MRGLRGAAVLGLVVAVAAGCRGSGSPTTSLEDIPTASRWSPYGWGRAAGDVAREGPRKNLGLEPPELLAPGAEDLPLPSGVSVARGERQTTIDQVLGRVNKDIITLSEVQELAQPLVARIRQELPPERQEEEIRRIQTRVLDRIIDQRLQIQHAERLGVEVSNRELDEAVADVIAKNNLTPEQFDALLAREGITMVQYRGKLREQIVRRRVFNFEVVSRTQVSDADIRDYYQDHLKELVPPPEVAISQILIASPADGDGTARETVQERAAQALAALERGEPFAEVARVLSDDPTGAQGGQVGRFARGEMIPELEQAAFAMREGEIRGPIPTDRGLHVLKVDRRWGNKPLPLEQVANRIRAKLLGERRQARYQEWMEVLRSEAFIERTDLDTAPAGGG